MTDPSRVERRQQARDRYSHQRPGDRSRRRRERRRKIVVALGAIALLLSGVGAYLVLENDGNENAAPAEVDNSAAALADPSTTLSDESPQESSTTPTSVLAPVVPTPPYVAATFDGKTVALTGTVADGQLVEQLNGTAQLIYGEFVTSEVEIDPQLDSPEWLLGAPSAVALLQTISSGSLVLSEGQLSVAGKAASTEDAEQLESFLGEIGLPVQVTDMEITDLREAVYIIAGSDGSVALSGALPTEEIRTGLADAAAAAYGPDNVFDASTVDPTVAATLWMYSPDALIATLSNFPDFEVRLDGPDFTASLSGGSVFGSNSTEISPEFAQVLNFGIVVLSRDPSMTINIEGHTDSEGPDDYNLELSQQRADAVAAYFAQAGIDQDRITAVGMGEQSPAAPNDTAEGRARNRRVEFSLQSVG